MTVESRPARGKLILCADDYGISAGVCDGILELIQAGCLSATGCMTNFPAFPERAARLLPFWDKIEIGLHITLTDFAPLGAMPEFASQGRLPSYGSLLKVALLNRIPRKEIGNEISRQILRFKECFGRLPVFVDGHHHVHQLPGIREPLFEVLKEHYASESVVGIRCNRDRASHIFRRRVSPGRALLIGFFGQGLMKAANRIDGPRHKFNAAFSGVYDYGRATDYEAVFEKFLSVPVPELLVMCHPGRSDAELESLDSLTKQREREFAYLAGPRFKPCLERTGWRLGGFLEGP